MELKEGIMTNSELAEWFDVALSTFKNTKKQKLEKLKEYAEFEELKGKVKIIEIKDTTFRKGSKNYKIIKEKTKEQWDDSGLDTCQLVANKIRKLAIKELKVENSTLYSYTCRSKRELWGKVNGFADGEIGYCRGEFCKIENDKCIELNEEEVKIKDVLLKKHFGSNDEKLAITQGLISSGEITKEEAAEMLIEMLETTHSNYYAFITELRALTGSKVVIGTRITNNAFRL